TYPVLVHGIPSTFDPSRHSSDIATLLNNNEIIIPHPSSLQHAEFLSPSSRHNTTPPKSHRSLILYFTDPHVANNCITRHIALYGRLLPTLKFTRRPPQCYNCHCFGHFARSCKNTTICGLCSGKHSSQACHCSN
ncbi:hypothetical protein K439DRAFT_1320373, partial [Ramaria rubella]